MNLDAIRIFGCYGVVLYHYLPYVSGKDGWPFWPFRNASVLVDVFFVISGVVIAYNYGGKTGSVESYFNYLRKRVARLYPLHLATLLFYSAIGVAALAGYLQVVDISKYNFAEWIPNVLMLHAWGFSTDTAFNFPSWTVSAELFAYILFPLVLAGATRSIISGIMMLLVLFAVCITLGELLTGRDLQHLTVPYAIFRALPSFAAGVVVYANRDAFPAVSKTSMRVVVFFSLAVFLAFMVGGAPSYLTLASAIVFASLAFVADHQHTSLGFGGAGTSRHAELTYSLYMIHAPVATVLMAFLFPRILGDWFQGEDTVRFLCVLVSIAVAVGASWISYRYFEVPARLWLSGRRQLRGPEPVPVRSAG